MLFKITNGYKLVCTYDDKFSKPAEIYRCENSVYKFIVRMLQEEEYCKEVIEKQWLFFRYIFQTLYHVTGKQIPIPAV